MSCRIIYYSFFITFRSKYSKMNQDNETISQDYEELDSLNIVNQNDESDKHGDSENTDPNGDENFYCSADDEDFFGLNQDRQDEDGEEEFVDPVVVEGRQDDIDSDADLDVVHKHPSLHSADPGGNSSSDSDGPLTKSPVSPHMTRFVTKDKGMVLTLFTLFFRHFVLGPIRGMLLSPHQDGARQLLMYVGS